MPLERRCSGCGYDYHEDPRVAANERVAHRIHGKHGYRGWTEADGERKRDEFMSRERDR